MKTERNRHMRSPDTVFDLNKWKITLTWTWFSLKQLPNWIHGGRSFQFQAMENDCNMNIKSHDTGSDSKQWEKKPIMHMPIPKTDFNLKPWKKTVTWTWNPIWSVTCKGHFLKQVSIWSYGKWPWRANVIPRHRFKLKPWKMTVTCICPQLTHIAIWGNGN